MRSVLRAGSGRRARVVAARLHQCRGLLHSRRRIDAAPGRLPELDAGRLEEELAYAIIQTAQLLVELPRFGLLLSYRLMSFSREPDLSCSHFEISKGSIVVHALLHLPRPSQSSRRG